MTTTPELDHTQSQAPACDLLSAAEAARLIGFRAVQMVYRLADLKPARTKPRLYHLADVQRIAGEYERAGRSGTMRRTKS